VGSVSRLRGLKTKASFETTVQHHGLVPGTDAAVRLARAIRGLRTADRLPYGSHVLVEFWGAERCWAHAFAYRLWLYYSPDDEYVTLWAVHDHLHD
jgi:hypothetical protein